MTLEIRTAPGPLEVRADGDGRTITGLAVPYGTETRIGSYLEQFAVGAFSGADPARVPLLAAHQRNELPIGRAATLTDTPAGLLVELRVSNTSYGDDVLTLVRDGAATGLSIGFVPVEDRWSHDRTRVTRIRATLAEVSIVGFPAYPSARVMSVRGRTFGGQASVRLRIARLR